MEPIAIKKVVAQEKKLLSSVLLNLRSGLPSEMYLTSSRSILVMNDLKNVSKFYYSRYTPKLWLI